MSDPRVLNWLFLYIHGSFKYCLQGSLFNSWQCGIITRYKFRLIYFKTYRGFYFIDIFDPNFESYYFERKCFNITSIRVWIRLVSSEKLGLKGKGNKRFTKKKNSLLNFFLSERRLKKPRWRNFLNFDSWDIF